MNGPELKVSPTVINLTQDFRVTKLNIEPKEIKLQLNQPENIENNTSTRVDSQGTTNCKKGKILKHDRLHSMNIFLQNMPTIS